MPTKDLTRRKVPEPHARFDRRMAIVVIAIAVLPLAMAGWIGWLVHGEGRHHDVTVLGNTFVGKVDIVNQGHSAGCVHGEAQRVCSDFIVLGGQSLRVGDTVRVVHEVYKNSPGNGFDMIVVLPRVP